MQEAALYEVVRLGVALLVLPFAVGFYRKLRDRPGTIAAFVAVSAIYASYIFTVIEAYVWGDVLNTLQHLSYGVAGIAIATASWQMRAHSAQRRRS